MIVRSTDLLTDLYPASLFLLFGVFFVFVLFLFFLSSVGGFLW